MLTVNQTTYGLIESYLSALDCPRSLAVWLMFKFNEHDQLIALDINPDLYLDPKEFRDAYLSTKFLSKATFLSTSVDKKKTAIDGFLACEQACRVVNGDGFRTSERKLSGFEWLHRAAQQTVLSILGDFTADEFFDSANWGPGITTLIKGDDVSSTNKFRLEGGITRPLDDFVSGLFAAAYPHWKPSFNIQFGSKVITVPKNSKTDRTIAVEPGINLWFQKSLGLMIRRRLLRFGLDLNSQVRNQQLALKGSKDSSLATVDFSNASDSISYSTVRELIPSRWFTLLDLCRSSDGRIGRTPVHYEKFSSMGNGFTFELESLIFFSIARAVCKKLRLPLRDVSVYGDDVIIPIEAFDLFCEVCSIYGFTVNRQKSFSSGWFRESCGSHYFAGVDCKPYYLKGVVKRESEIYVAANTVRRTSRFSYGCDKRFRKCFDDLTLRVDKHKICRISEGYGDAGFISNFDEVCPPRAPFQLEGWMVKGLISVPVGYSSDDHALLLARLKDCSAPNRDLYILTRSGQLRPDLHMITRPIDSGGNTTFFRKRVFHVRKRLLIRRWTDLGPWI